MHETGSNVEIAQHVHEHGHASGRKRLWIEVGEALLLALVAVSTAWSGYQAALWDGREAKLYGTASHLRFQANALQTRGGQEQVYDSTTLNSWLQAKLSGDEKLARFYARRYLPDYRPAFRAWLGTDPLHNPRAPRGPIYMPQYHNTKIEQAEVLDARASDTFDRGSDARHSGDDYVRATVLLATVLFLIAISQRFDIPRVRTTLLGLAVVLLAVALGVIVTLPRL
jgi:hypothetical protein